MLFVRGRNALLSRRLEGFAGKDLTTGNDAPSHDIAEIGGRYEAGLRAPVHHYITTEHGKGGHLWLIVVILIC